MAELHRSKPGRGNEKPINLSQHQAEQFWLLADEDTSGCWEWVGRIRSTLGYGYITVNRSMLMAHRVAWTLVRGPIPNNVTLDHLCRNRRCINPAHLELVSNKVNILRGDSPTAINARKTHCKRGHEFTPENTRLHHERRECRVCIKIRQRREWSEGRRRRGTSKQSARFCMKCRRYTRLYRRLDDGLSRHVICSVCES